MEGSRSSVFDKYDYACNNRTAQGETGMCYVTFPGVLINTDLLCTSWWGRVAAGKLISATRGRKGSHTGAGVVPRSHSDS